MAGGTSKQNVTFQPETEAVMKWSQALPFVLSVSLLGGKEVVSYPYNRIPPQGNHMDNWSFDASHTISTHEIWLMCTEKVLLPSEIIAV